MSEIRFVDELPAASRQTNPDIALKMTTVENDSGYHGKWVELARHKEAVKAASVASGQRQKFGPPDAGGWAFATRADGEESVVYARYTPHLIVDGKLAAHKAEQKAKADAAALKRAEKKAKEERLAAAQAKAKQ